MSSKLPLPPVMASSPFMAMQGPAKTANPSFTPPSQLAGGGMMSMGNPLLASGLPGMVGRPTNTPQRITSGSTASPMKPGMYGKQVFPFFL